VPIIRRNSCIYATLGTCYSVCITVWYAYFFSLHVSGSYVPIIRRNSCIYATLGTCYSVWMTVWYAPCTPFGVKLNTFGDGRHPGSFGTIRRKIYYRYSLVTKRAKPCAGYFALLPSGFTDQLVSLHCSALQPGGSIIHGS
jgi:hypothetical protein